MNNICKVTTFGITSLFAYHSYCGYKLCVSEHSSQSDKLVTNRILSGVCNGIVSIFPMFLVSIFKDLNRLEVFIRNDDPSNYGCVFDEVIYKYPNKK